MQKNWHWNRNTET